MKYFYAYGNISVPSTAVTLICCYYAWDSPSGASVSMLPWVKIISSAVLLLYIHLFKSSVLFFYMNLGMSRQRFYGSILSIDIALFILLITISLLIK